MIWQRDACGAPFPVHARRDFTSAVLAMLVPGMEFFS